MREVEIKAKVANKQDLFDRLNQQAISLSQPLTQEDSVYAQIVLDPDHAKNNWLRIRQEGSRHAFTLKYAVNNELDNMEYETEVSNPKQLEQIIFRLGFKKHSEISKVR